jgi:hypothetical protein
MDMDREPILDLYEWAPGICFRHPDRGAVDTAAVKTLRPRVGSKEVVRACRDCVLEMERDRQAAAGQEGAHYEPGRAGQELA